jgi:sterol desaturase/sphingolipid hydroxylase (fatty acid hydroxylase superfamily)
MSIENKKVSGAFEFGQGQISGFLAVLLGGLNLLAVIAFHFPEYLSTPEVRKAYDVEVLRLVLSVSIFVSVFCGCFTILRGQYRRYGLTGLTLTFLCLVLGGPFVPVGDFPENTPYIGLDWLILDLIGSAFIFIMIEKAFPYKKDQPILRPQWSLDGIHFAINHLLIGASLLVANSFAPTFFSWAQWSVVQKFVTGLPFGIELLLCVFVADLFQYMAHRSLHEVPWLWRLHAVHHCPENMDWLAGSRQHFFELVMTRALVLVPIFVLGFEKKVIDAYVIIVGIQAVFNHANVRIDFGFLKNIIVTPQFHHWHHSSDSVAIDKNYAAHFSFIDRLFGTDIKTDQEWPKEYGIVGRQLPANYLAHFTYPFKPSFWKKDLPTK